MIRASEKRSFGYCSETCPDVDRLFAEFLEKIKEVGTARLRKALAAACEDLIDAENKIEELEGIIEDLRSEIFVIQELQE